MRVINQGEQMTIKIPGRFVGILSSANIDDISNWSTKWATQEELMAS